MKTQKRVEKLKQAKAEPPSAQDVKAELPTVPQVINLENPPPEYLLQEAKNEPQRRVLDDYGDVISLLRDEKRLTFREIAEWLNGYGFEVDHNAVYREYAKGLTHE